MSEGSLVKVQQRLGQSFRDESLLRLALTHRSFGSPNNERLEFVGDAIVNLCAAQLLFERFPAMNEGELTQLRSQLVSRPKLAVLGAHLQLGDALRMSAGELRSGGRQRDSLLADAFEALMGALYLDAGLEVTRERLNLLLLMLLEKVENVSVAKDSKTRLQEWLQDRHHALPQYQLTRTSGVDHAPVFEVTLDIAELNLRVQGTGTSRRRAEQAAATQALRRVQQMSS